jgi:uncharacterized protein with GYD domain
MAIYFLTGQYSPGSMKDISTERTAQAMDIIKKYQGEVISSYVLLGEKDLVIITNFPGLEQVMKASVALTQLTGISFSTAPAVVVEEFDGIMADL